MFVPTDKEPIIAVWNCRVQLGRWRLEEPDKPLSSFTIEIADNWEALEDEAETELEALGGWRTASGNYPCPDNLAAKAKYSESENEQ